MTAGFTNQEDNYGKNEKTKTAEVAVQCSLRRAFYFTAGSYICGGGKQSGSNRSNAHTSSPHRVL